MPPTGNDPQNLDNARNTTGANTTDTTDEQKKKARREQATAQRETARNGRTLATMIEDFTKGQKIKLSADLTKMIGTLRANIEKGFPNLDSAARGGRKGKTEKELREEITQLYADLAAKKITPDEHAKRVAEAQNRITRLQAAAKKKAEADKTGAK